MSLTKEELIDLVQRIMDVDGTEAEIDQWIEIFEENTSHPDGSDLIFFCEDNFTAKMIIEKALNYKPIEITQML